jgi:hypothetical protein
MAFLLSGKASHLPCFSDAPYFDACFYVSTGPSISKYHVLLRLVCLLCGKPIFGFVRVRQGQMALTQVRRWELEEGRNFKLTPKYLQAVLSYIQHPMEVQHRLTVSELLGVLQQACARFCEIPANQYDYCNKTIAIVLQLVRAMSYLAHIVNIFLRKSELFHWLEARAGRSISVEKYNVIVSKRLYL